MKLFLSLEFALFPKKKILTVEKFNIDLCSNMKKNIDSKISEYI